MWNKLAPALAILVCVCGFVACEKKLSTIELSINNKKFTVEVARTKEEMSIGLMYRKSMGDYEGMIFVYTDYVRNAFWMKNTEIPLSIAFITRQGKIVDIKDMKPFSESPVSPLLSYVYALELNQGAFEKAGVKAGDTIQIPAAIQ
jgi:uncharacterized membrane protein (UPF0127 family)